jgi:hypothetical protein
VLPGIAALDRTTINAWEDTEFRQTVRAAGRRKLIMAALWTEARLTFPSLDAMREGYETYVVTDAVGGTSPEAHHGQRSSRGPLRRARVMSPSEVGWRRNVGDPAGAVGSRERSLVTTSPCGTAVRSHSATGLASRDAMPTGAGGVRDE